MFLYEYLKNPRKVGAISESSKYLAYEMINTINFEDTNCIVEYGPGTGAFTEKILARAKENTIIILVEINKSFYNILKKMYGHKRNVVIINDSAEKIDEILKAYSIEKVDYIISGLPFASLSKKISNEILDKTSKILGEHGEFITFQYTLVKEKYIQSFFRKVNHTKVIRNFPPAYVLRCKGGKNESEDINCR